MNELGLGAFHHVGVAVKDIRAATARFSESYGAVADSEIFHDENQRVYVQLMKMGDLRIELLAPAAERSPVDQILDKGIAVYHVCHEVDDMEGTLQRLTKAGARTISPPKPAVAFDNRRVAFVMCEGFIVELLESAASPAE